MDNEFEKLTNLVLIIQINTTAAKEHVPEIERRIRLIKERGRGVLNILPFKKLPRLILIELIYHVVLWLNAFPLKNSGVSANLSPRELVIRHMYDFKKHCRAQFGSYCEVHDEPVPTNSMTSRTTPAIVLGPTGNLQGTYKFFSLTTGKKLKRRQFTPYPMPDTVIALVERYGTENALPGIFDFADRNGVLFEWNDDVDECPEGILEEDDVVLYPSIAAELPGVDLEHDTPRPSIEADLIPHGQAEDAAARNANHEPLPACVGVVGSEGALRSHFLRRHPQDLVVCPAEGSLPLPQCNRCGLQISFTAINGRHYETAMCKDGVARKVQYAAAEHAVRLASIAVGDHWSF